MSGGVAIYNFTDNLGLGGIQHVPFMNEDTAKYYGKKKGFTEQEIGQRIIRLTVGKNTNTHRRALQNERNHAGKKRLAGN